MEDTWFSRDVVVLEAIVSTFNEDLAALPSIETIAARAGMDVLDVGRAAVALDGTYITLKKVMSGGNPAPWFIVQVLPAARQAVGQWPTGESLTDDLVAGLAAAIERVPDVERRSRLRASLDTLSTMGRDLTVDVLARLLERHSGL